jgi:lipid II:glycine glycyltransferase (peptidoglycan interpeptide bridge formation enzyme)
MIASIRELDQIGEEVWDDFVEQHPLGSIYHHSAWHHVIEETYGYRGRYCIVESGDRIRAALPFVLINNLPFRKRLVSYPYSDSCDPLVRERDELDAIMGTIEESLKSGRIASAEVRTVKLAEMLHRDADSGSRYCNFVLALEPGKEKLFRSFHRNCVQRGIRKAQDFRVEVVEGRDLSDMKQFYGLHVSTRKRHGVPPQPFRFFRNLWEKLYPRNMLSLLLGMTNGVCAAAVVLLKFKDSVYYKFAAGDRRFLVKRPNHLLIWRIIETAVEEGYRYLDFGRTFTGDRGLMQWKARWGAVPLRFDYIYPGDCNKSRFNQQGDRANVMISSVLKKMPCFALRMSGELFYKYLA